jgi:hypothetical protein
MREILKHIESYEGINREGIAYDIYDISFVDDDGNPMEPDKERREMFGTHRVTPHPNPSDLT